MVNNLLGKNINNKWNLSGKLYNTNISIPIAFTNIKIKIIDTFILPLISNKWKHMKDNIFLLDSYKQKLDNYYNLYKIEEIPIYKNIIDLIELFVNQSLQLEETENRIYKNDNDLKDNNVSLVYKTAMIKLKPEYELYDSIIGKPKKILKQKYNENIIKDIQSLMIMENITYEKIKIYIDNNYF